jgi:putative chitinase
MIEGILAQQGSGVLAKYEVTTPLRLAHFMAQISHECDGGQIIRENMNYNAQRMLEIFGAKIHSAKVTPAEAKQLAHHPVEIAERVYGTGNPKKMKELGNFEVGDAYKYRGNGMLQLTGKEAHARIGAMIDMDLVGRPEQLEDPGHSFRCALAEFQASHCIPAADADDITRVTELVNGGHNGLGERKAWFRRWKAALDREMAEVGTVPQHEIKEAVEADKAPRGAESPAGPILDPATSVISGAGTGGSTVALDEVIKQVQHDVTPLAYTLTGLKWVLIACSLALFALAIYGIVMKRIEARRV